MRKERAYNKSLGAGFLALRVRTPTAQRHEEARFRTFLFSDPQSQGLANGKVLKARPNLHGQVRQIFASFKYLRFRPFRFLGKPLVQEKPRMLIEP